jgi:hypothetical protein
MLQRWPGAGLAAAAAAARPIVKPHDEGDDVELLQLKLNHHLGFLRQVLLDVDGSYSWSTLNALNLFCRLKKIPAPKGGVVDGAIWDELDKDPATDSRPAKAGEGGKGPEYARMMNDGLLEVTFAAGFDEGGTMIHEIHELERGLTDVRGYRLDFARAEELRKAAGRLSTNKDGDHYVKENAAMAPDGTIVNVVLRFVKPATEGQTGASGATSRAAALAGMDESDVFLYGGHARYGTGPDFDRSYHFVVHWDKVPNRPKDKAGVTEIVPTAKELTALLRVYGKEQFEKLEKAGAVDFVADAGGNIAINPEPLSHVHDLGAYFMKRAVGGRKGDLADNIWTSKYRLWLFNGCTTKDYVKEIRKDPLMTSKDLDMTVTDPAALITSFAEGILSYLDGVIAKESAAALDERMENATPFEWNTHHNEGFEDNP